MGRTSDANERLMTAALALMWEQSYGSVSIDDICRRADVKKGSFYYFFDSKSDLAVQALERHWQAEKREMDEIFSPATAPLERIKAYSNFIYKRQVESKRKSGHVLGCPLCCLGSEICTQDKAISGKVREILERKGKYWESAVRDAQAAGVLPAGDATARARCALAYLQGLMAQARLNNDVEVLRDLGRLMLEHLNARKSVAQVA